VPITAPVTVAPFMEDDQATVLLPTPQAPSTPAQADHDLFVPFMEDDSEDLCQQIPPRTTNSPQKTDTDSERTDQYLPHGAAEDTATSSTPKPKKKLLGQTLNTKELSELQAKLSSSPTAKHNAAALSRTSIPPMSARPQVLPRQSYQQAQAPSAADFSSIASIAAIAAMTPTSAPPFPALPIARVAIPDLPVPKTAQQARKLAAQIGMYRGNPKTAAEASRIYQQKESKKRELVEAANTMAFNFGGSASSIDSNARHGLKPVKRQRVSDQDALDDRTVESQDEAVNRGKGDNAAGRGSSGDEEGLLLQSQLRWVADGKQE